MRALPFVQDSLVGLDSLDIHDGHAQANGPGVWLITLRTTAAVSGNLKAPQM